MIFIVISLIFTIACGEHINKDEDLVAGYQFKRDSLLWMRTSSLFSDKDSIPFHVNDFGVIDTLPEFERYIIVDTAAHDRKPIYLPFLPTAHGNGMEFKSNLRLKYGAKSFDNKIVIFPRFHEFIDLTNGYYGVRLYLNTDVWGILHVRGQMVTDVKYDWLSNDPKTGNILAGYWNSSGDTSDIMDTIRIN